jgi:hypothetical protein
MRKFVAFVKRNWELYGEMVEEEINPLDINVKMYGKGNASCMGKVLGGNRNGVIEFNASYNKSQPDALFLTYFDKELYMFRTDLLSIIRNLSTVYTAIGICHASYVDCLLARAGWNLMPAIKQMTSRVKIERRTW